MSIRLLSARCHLLAATTAKVIDIERIQRATEVLELSERMLVSSSSTPLH